VGIDVVGRPVRCPARVTDARRAGGRPVAEMAHQVLQPAGFLAQVQALARQGGESRAVVAAVLEALQARDEDRAGLPAAGVADDSAHGRPSRQDRTLQSTGACAAGTIPLAAALPFTVLLRTAPLPACYRTRRRAP